MKTLTSAFLFPARRKWYEMGALIGASWLVPLLIHLIPWSGPRPIGVALLPAFWTAFLATYFFDAIWGVVIVVAVPVINHVITGLPDAGRLLTMTMELSAYVVVTAGLIRVLRNASIAAPLGFVFAKAIVIAILWSLPAFHYARDPIDHFVGTLRDCSAGMVILLLLHLAVWRWAPQRS